MSRMAPDREVWAPRVVASMVGDGWDPEVAALMVDMCEELIYERGCRRFFRLHGVPLMDQPVPEWMRKAVFERDGHQCQHCGVTSGLQIDPIIPRSRWGPNEMSNLQVLCGTCNLRKGAS